MGMKQTMKRMRHFHCNGHSRVKRHCALWMRTFNATMPQ